MREVRVKAIHNRTKELFQYPTTSSATIDVPPGGVDRGDLGHQVRGEGARQDRDPE